MKITQIRAAQELKTALHAAEMMLDMRPMAARVRRDLGDPERTIWCLDDACIASLETFASAVALTRHMRDAHN